MIYSIAKVGMWLSVSTLAYMVFKSSKHTKKNLKIMSVRKVLKQYKRLNDADNKSIF